MSFDQDPDDEWEEVVSAREDGEFCPNCGDDITQVACEQGERFCPNCLKKLFGEISESDHSYDDYGWCPYCIDKVHFRSPRDLNPSAYPRQLKVLQRRLPVPHPCPMGLPAPLRWTEMRGSGGQKCASPPA